MFFTRGYTGRQLAVVIWDMPSGAPANIIDGTDTLLYPDDSARVYNLRIRNGLGSRTVQFFVKYSI